MSFQDQVVFITGGASGIGKAAAIAFAKAGAIVAFSDIQEEAGKEVEKEIAEAGGRGKFYLLNVAEYEEVKDTLEKVVEEFGKLDVALNNAGIGVPPMFTKDIPLEIWHHVIAVNQNGVFYCMKEELKYMEPAGKGSIINISSLSGLRSFPKQLAYGASKFAVIGMTKTTAVEYARKGIRVNAICPVFIDTPMVDQVLSTAPELEAKLVKGIPVGRMGKPDDVVNAIMWLANPKSDFITGLALPVDGGQMA